MEDVISDGTGGESLLFHRSASTRCDLPAGVIGPLLRAACKRPLEEYGLHRNVAAGAPTSALPLWQGGPSPSFPMVGGMGGQRLNQVTGYIETNLDQDLSIRQLAAVIDLSPAQASATRPGCLHIDIWMLAILNGLAQ